MIFLDAAATARPRREALEAMWPWLTQEFGNASSHHELGESAARALSEARASVAEVLGARPSEIVFTSGGTEANNLAVKGISLASMRGRHIVTTAIEHEAVLESCDALARLHGVDVTIVGVDRDGLVEPDEVEAAFRDDTALCAVMLANNEVGTVQPVAQIADRARRHGIPVHTDAVQAAGWLDVRDTGADSLALSGHKVGAPKGVGALWVRGRVPLEPLVHGGGQERGRRSGTENVAGAVALATALRLADADRRAHAERVAVLRAGFVDEVLERVPEARLTGAREPRLPGHASFCFPGTSGESILLELGRRGIVCSSGSACAAGSDEPSHVLVAMGIESAIAQTAVRFTFGVEITHEQLEFTANALVEASSAVRALGRH